MEGLSSIDPTKTVTSANIQTNLFKSCNDPKSNFFIQEVVLT